MDEPTTSWKRTLYASVVAQFFCMIGFSFAFPFMPLYIQTLGVDDPLEVRRWAGLVGSAAGFTMAVFAPIWGGVADRFGRKMMVLRSMFGGAVIMVLMGFARRPEHLLLLRLIQGALSGTITANLALVASAAPTERTGYAIGMVHASAHAGRVLGPCVGGIVADHFGFRTAFCVGGVFLMAGGALIQALTHEPAGRRDGPQKREAGSYASLFLLSGFSVALLAMFQVQFATSIAMPLFPLYVEALRGTSRSASTITGAILTVNAVAAVIGTGALGQLGDRWGHKRLLIVSTLSAAIVLFLHAFARGVADLFVLRGLLGLATAGIQPSAGALVRVAVPEHSVGKAFGIVQSVRSLGVAVGPLVGGYISAQFAGSLGFRIPFLVTGILLVFVPVVIALALRRPDAGPRAGASARP